MFHLLAAITLLSDAYFILQRIPYVDNLHRYHFVQSLIQQTFPEKPWYVLSFLQGFNISKSTFPAWGSLFLAIEAFWVFGEYYIILHDYSYFDRKPIPCVCSCAQHKSREPHAVYTLTRFLQEGKHICLHCPGSNKGTSIDPPDTQVESAYPLLPSLSLSLPSSNKPITIFPTDLPNPSPSVPLITAASILSFYLNYHNCFLIQVPQLISASQSLQKVNAIM